MALTAEKIEEFLDRLNSEVAFRERLVNDPASVMDEYGISYTAEDLVAPNGVKLPEPGEVNANRDAYRDKLFEDNEFTFNAPDYTMPGSTAE